MDTRRLLIAGDMLFAETLARLLTPNPEIEVVSIAPDLDTAHKLVNVHSPDALIYASQSDEGDQELNRFLTDNPNLSIICTDRDKNSIRVIVSQRISIHSSGDLLAAILNLPIRS